MQMKKCMLAKLMLMLINLMLILMLINLMLMLLYLNIGDAGADLCIRIISLCCNYDVLH